ncbi:MAG: hypothetical protein MUF08_00495 [Burkholderiaceae bacterium]|jgi:hypothetical protein|nr:hypothetical protein [Burkholderiaceae bacterium]
MPWVNIPTLTDWQYDEDTKKLRHNTGSARVTVNTLYSALMDLADDAGFMDSSVPMSAQTPVEYTLINGWQFDADADLGYLYGGSIVVQKATTDRDVWANFYTLGTIEADAVMYLYQNGALVASHPGYTAGHIDQLCKVVAAGSDISTDSIARAVAVFARNNAAANADLYDHFVAQASATGGRNPVPIATAPDTNDDGSGSGVTGVTLTFGATSQDIGDGNGNQPYSVIVDGGGNSVLVVYRRLKFLTRRENTSAVGSGTSVQGRFYRAANTAYAEIKVSPFGSFAGGKLFGARGVWLTNVSDPNNRSLVDNNNVTRTPPVQMTVSVTGVAASDRVLVARATAGVINKAQFTILSTTASSVTVTTTPAADIPTGAHVLRIGDTRYTYTSRSGAVFSGVSPSPSGATGSLWVPIIDDAAAGTSIASPAMTYAADFDVVARVRKKSILPFENTASVTSTGASIAAIRTADTIVT